MFRLSIAVVVALFTVHILCLAAERPDAHECTTAAARLRAPSLREKAWGAHFATVCRMPGIATNIAAELEQMDPYMSGRPIWSESESAAYGLLDALIQLRQPLEERTLASIFQKFPTEATILMLQNPSRSCALLAKVRDAQVPLSIWVASSNTLAHLRSPGFAATLMREIRPTHSVWISDTGKWVPEGTPGSGLLSNSNMQVPSGFPPVGRYWLTAERAPGDELVSDGTTPIYSRRVVVEPSVNRSVIFPSDGFCLRCERNCPECQTKRIEYLAELAHVPSRDLSRVTFPLTQVTWKNVAEVDAEISRALAKQIIGLRRLAKQLVSLGVLETSDLDLTLQIKVAIQDRRSDRSISLPQHVPVEFRLR